MKKGFDNLLDLMSIQVKKDGKMIRVPIWSGFLNFLSKNLSSLMIYCRLTIKVNLFSLEAKSKFSFGLQFYKKPMQNFMGATTES